MSLVKRALVNLDQRRVQRDTYTSAITHLAPGADYSSAEKGVSSEIRDKSAVQRSGKGVRLKGSERQRRLLICAKMP